MSVIRLPAKMPGPMQRRTLTPFAVLPGQDRTGQADQGRAAGDDAGAAGAAADLAVQAFPAGPAQGAAPALRPIPFLTIDSRTQISGRDQPAEAEQFS
jgi:hypothetical protein